MKTRLISCAGLTFRPAPEHSRGLAMKAYFLLQHKMANRRLHELGIHPVVGCVLAAGCFILISEYLFYKTEFAKYVVVLTALSLLAKTSETNRTEFLKVVFDSKKFRNIRIVENGLICLPFSILLGYHQALPEAILLLAGSVFLAGFTLKNNLNHALPTPFYHRPFEFTVGFRNTFYLLPLPYILTVIALSVDNLNLGMFAMLLIFLIALTYYVKPENQYFVWIYSSSPSAFIFEKLKTATLYAAFLVAPIVVSLIMYYPQHTGIILLLGLTGFAFLWTMVLAKYAAYPNELNLPEGILMALCIYFPPLLLALIPFFYSKSVKKLHALLK